MANIRVYVYVAVALKDLLGIVGGRPGVQHRERAAPEQRVKAALSAVEQLVNLALRQILETTARTDARVDEF